uniref:Glutamyl-tRNA(Gln) amidotransferase subunit A, mitochondrial-like n=1 Tax=Saccoglossus kowalevskii TaxID=10224 RepID=A0ABM0MXD2_SACKO
MISTLRPCVTSLTYSRLIQQQLLRPVYRLASSTYGPERACSRDENVYKAPAARVPSIKRLQEIATNNGLDINNEYLNHYRDFIENVICSAMDVVDSYPEPTLPVKYPRTPGYRPKQVENQLNGWYWRCDIKGADDGILHGKTVAIKDNIPVAGVPMMNGSYVLEGYVPEYDATVVTKILDAGGRITGKSTCEDMCFSGTSYITTKGAVRNPHNTNYAAGGSSSGCAALAIAGPDNGLDPRQPVNFTVPSYSKG